VPRNRVQRLVEAVRQAYLPYCALRGLIDPILFQAPANDQRRQALHKLQVVRGSRFRFRGSYSQILMDRRTSSFFQLPLIRSIGHFCESCLLCPMFSCALKSNIGNLQGGYWGRCHSDLLNGKLTGGFLLIRCVFRDLMLELFMTLTSRNGRVDLSGLYSIVPRGRYQHRILRISLSRRKRDM